MCDILKEIYREIYDEPFDYMKLDHRIELQKAVYLLENMGVQVGDYSFTWDKYGPYSLELDVDACNCSKKEELNVNFSLYAKNGFERIRKYVSKGSVYSRTHWIECIASLHYLKNIFRIRDAKLLQELKIRKPYLSDETENRKAVSLLKEVKVVA